MASTSQGSSTVVTSVPTSTVISTTISNTPTTTAVSTAVPITTTIQSVATTTAAPSTSVTSLEPSSTIVVTPSQTQQPTTVVTQVTSVITQTPPAGGTGGIVTTITSTQPVVTITPTASGASTISLTSSSATSSRSALSASGSSGSSSGGLSSGATIAIAVIIPIVAVIALVIFGLWFWRRRKNKKDAEEQRKNEMAEYGFNPNHDPTLPVAAAAYTDGASEGNDDSGYRGWGATTASNRKASTTLGSNSHAAAIGGVGVAMSDGGSQAHSVQPSPGNSDSLSQDPLVQGYQDAATTGAVGAAALAGGIAAGSRSNRYSQVSALGGINREPSNASSAYSGHAARSEASSDVPDVPRPYYQEEVPYNIYNEVQPGHGPYGDDTYVQNDQPVIRDVQARRNTRIERVPTFPQQGGISQNF